MRGKKEKSRAVRSGGRDSVERDHYHHGDLQQALIDATDAILTERGVEGFTLREAARRAGVSPAAPTHHFGSTAGLLTEVAIRGFNDLARNLREANERGGTDPREQMVEQGLAYVRFAIAYPGRFQLMFRHAKLRPDDERIHTAGRSALSELESVAQRCVGSDEAGDENVTAIVVGAWSIAHGFAQLALDGKFDRIKGPEDLSKFVAAMFPAALAVLWNKAEHSRAQSKKSPKKGTPSTA